MTRLLLLRIIQLILLLILILLLANKWFSQVNDFWWQRPVKVVLYPINADSEPLTGAFIDQLSEEHFEDIEGFFQREAKRYRLELQQPVLVDLAPRIDSLPPQVPDDASILDAIWWSVKMRLWVWQHDSYVGDADARIFMNFHLPGTDQPMPRHSLGLQRGQIGLVNGLAGIDYLGRNNLIAAHELLHTFGATDKYDPDTNQPVWPDGYAEPTKTPLYPQTKAEIMGGRVLVSPGWAMLPPDLEHVIIGAATAIEINWLAAPQPPQK